MNAHLFATGCSVGRSSPGQMNYSDIGGHTQVSEMFLFNESMAGYCVSLLYALYWVGDSLNSQQHALSIMFFLLCPQKDFRLRIMISGDHPCSQSQGKVFLQYNHFRENDPQGFETSNHGASELAAIVCMV